MEPVRKYRITNAQRRDEWPSKYGTMVDYAIALEGEEGWIKLTQKPETRPPQIGDDIEGYIFNDTNKNGESFRKFKKQNANFADRPNNQSSQANQGDLKYIVQMLEELTGRRAPPEPAPSQEELNDPFAGL